MNQSGIYLSEASFSLKENHKIIKLKSHKMHHFVDFYAYLQRKLKFPSYFGSNLDAMEECLMDLSWFQKKDQLVIIFENAKQLLKEEKTEDIQLVWQIFEDVAEYWKDQDFEFIVVKD